jgi:hypothetical protein
MAWSPHITLEELTQRARAHWQARFPVGSRVRIPTERVAHITTDLPSEYGVVVGYGHDPEVIQVRLDGATKARGWHVSFLEADAPRTGTGE